MKIKNALLPDTGVNVSLLFLSINDVYINIYIYYLNEKFFWPYRFPQMHFSKSASRVPLWLLLHFLRGVFFKCDRVDLT